MSWLTTILLRGGRALVVAITMLPVLVFVILSAPAWVVWPWLGDKRRESVHRMVDQLTQWTRDVLYQTVPLSAADARQALSHNVVVSDSRTDALITALRRSVDGSPPSA
jgi:hypothetical protein